MVYVVSERPAAGLSGLMVDPGGLGSEDTANSRLALYSSTTAEKLTIHSFSRTNLRMKKFGNSVRIYIDFLKTSDASNYLL